MITVLERRGTVEAAHLCATLRALAIPALSIHRDADLRLDALPVAALIPIRARHAGETSAGLDLPTGTLFSAIAQGTRTIGYGAGLSELPLEARCALLLTGVELLLDADAPDFSIRLKDAILGAMRRRAAQREEQARIDDVLANLSIVARSASLRTVIRRLLCLAAVGAVPVLIGGETGTGKEIAARILHSRDPRRAAGPFVPVNCAALARSLVESELFGHRRGSFSGALQDRLGLVRAAHGGVLFLDEVGELDLDAQAKLLRVIQEGRVLPIGEDREVAVDVRVVAATHRDLAELVRAGKFREDLYYRLCVITVEVPPLRERKEDIGPLARHFARQYAELRGEVAPALGPDFVDALGRMRLPGNVRELENLVFAAMSALDHEGPLTLRALPRSALEELAGAERSQRASSPPEAPTPIEGWNLSEAVDACERSLVAAALAECRGNQAAAAKLLGVTPRTVFNKLHRHGIGARSRSGLSLPPPATEADFSQG